ncbi:MAG: isopentenyl-diphosphate Delta-isomerase [Bacteroides sp.]|nr:isopentenyl-diphosphate Delta-isomerase [Bacteroides sp.]
MQKYIEEVILVDEQDTPLGTIEKQEAHEKGELHRAFSIFLFDSVGRLLLQQRAWGKYHSAGLWTNSCCSHPSPGETTAGAAQRRLLFEMGLETPLKHLFTFQYKVPFASGLCEHEIDHVWVGWCDTPPCIHPEEVADYCYKYPEEIRQELRQHPEKYTAWLRIVFEKVVASIEKNYKENKR